MLMGAHVAIYVRAKFPSTTTILIVFALFFVHLSHGSFESDVLLNFKSSLRNTDTLTTWNNSVEPCQGDRSTWLGVLCLDGRVYGIQLESKGLSGSIDTNSLYQLPFFRTLSLMDNNFEGSLPDIKRLGKLKALYLSNNLFSGVIPDDAFQGMGSLKRLFLANNQLTGKIPTSLVTLSRLSELKLEGNQFQGQIPDFRQESLKIDVASNELVGPIPASLSKLNAQSFSGNKGLCDPPLAPCNGSAPKGLCDPPLAPCNGSAPKSQHKVPSDERDHTMLIVILVIVGLTLLIIVMALVAICRRNQGSKIDRTELLVNDLNKARGTYGGVEEAHEVAVEVAGGGGNGRRSENNNNTRLIFLRDDIEKFDLQDLLRASAEVLGSGTFGASYKAVVVGGQPLVVKRYRHMNNVGREEFHEHMRRIGRLSHPNLLPLAAYYYRREEKLLVTEFMENGSLASHLHGNHSPEDEALDWPTRLKIVKGIVRGLAYLYREIPTTVPHGHLKSSNVLLDDYYEPLLSDYALTPVINQDHARSIMIAYKSPEYSLHGQSSKKTDIWSLGILILEILTGRFPENYLTVGYNRKADLATWVNDMVKEKRTSEVFDKDMMGTKDSKGEMISLLKVGLSCCEEDVERRLDINEVVEKIEEIKEGDEEFYGGEFASYNVKMGDDDLASPMER